MNASQTEHISLTQVSLLVQEVGNCETLYMCAHDACGVLCSTAELSIVRYDRNISGR